jgi:hypothetical protein
VGQPDLVHLAQEPRDGGEVVGAVALERRVLVDGDLFGSGRRAIFLVNLPLGVVGSASPCWRRSSSPTSTTGTRPPTR